MSEGKDDAATWHTPGPWYVRFDGKRNVEMDANQMEVPTFLHIQSDQPAFRSSRLATVHFGRRAVFHPKVKFPRDEAVANAYLISAAPDLLDALRDAEAGLRWAIETSGKPCHCGGGVVCTPHKALEVVVAAIAKATVPS